MKFYLGNLFRSEKLLKEEAFKPMWKILLHTKKSGHSIFDFKKVKPSPYGRKAETSDCNCSLLKKALYIYPKGT